ncbi:N-acetylmuramoyl-L-alanine amidase [Roseospirillum parvum]|uniref:N-acetylmuramoyl-L-alanine amidase n=1 Tax=Roseospirillum parvum TaxID=83401 RepID=A0A1G8EJY5_9PROT|nr:N-acetylmuramoyl-L-alanine amidase [Roseospirillum parvum]SDH70126.1 N-acetylmuramoyl-L-alanine amidase [Roseospirillum parvum]
MIHTPSPNHGPRPAGIAIDLLIVHYTGMTSARAALERLCDPVAQVSAHYLIEEDGTAHQLVPEERRAWHAGVAHWAGAGNINDRSIGIELVNPGHEFGYRPFPASQIDRLIELATAIRARHPIPVQRVIGHADVAPSRKQDPGELFPWPRLAEHGLGLWPDPDRPPPAELLTQPPEDLLRLIGYDTADLPASLCAFQRHFLPDHLSAQADPPTVRRLAQVAAAMRS